MTFPWFQDWTSWGCLSENEKKKEKKKKNDSGIKYGDSMAPSSGVAAHNAQEKAAAGLTGQSRDVLQG